MSLVEYYDKEKKQQLCMYYTATVISYKTIIYIYFKLFSVYGILLLQNPDFVCKTLYFIKNPYFIYMHDKGFFLFVLI